jgi:hypothetical protein
MVVRTVKNATTSINYYFDTTVKAAVHANVSRDVCFYYEGNQKLTYPAFFIHHFIMGAPTNYQKQNTFSVSIFVNKSQDMLAWDLMDEFYNAGAFQQDNVSQFKFIPLYDWSDKNNPVQTGCIRLVLPQNQGFDYRDDIDRNVRIYSIDVDAYYI